MTALPRCAALITALLLAAAPAAAQAPQVLVTPAQPRANESITISSAVAGELHWGVNGWRLPAPSDRPLGSRVVDGALRTRLSAAGGRFEVTVGPFVAGAVHELNFVIQSGASWINDAGADFRVVVDANAHARKPITIGRGPWIGRTMGEEFYEEFQDWEQADGRSLDGAGDVHKLNDGGDDSRDLVALYSRRTADDLLLRVDLFDLALGAEQGLVNVAVLIDAAPGGQEHLPDFVVGRASAGWELAVVVESADRFHMLDKGWARIADQGQDAHLWRGSYLRSDLDAWEFGLSLEALRRAGWDGRRELRFQAITFKPGLNQLCDVMGQAHSRDRVEASFSESDGLGTAKFSSILHGNQHIKRASEIFELVRNTHTTTPAGHPTGYYRALETHQVFSAKVNVHVSGSLAASLRWARNPDGAYDGEAFNAWIQHLLRTNKAALLGGTFAEHIMPFFEGSGVTPASARLKDEVLEKTYGGHQPRVFWTPERVIRAATFSDILASGYEWTVVDQANHVWEWYGKGEALSKRGHKINRINGVNCFLINDDADQKKFWTSDGGAHHDLRHMLLGKAQDPDQEQLTLVFDDWEAYAGRSFTSFGVGNSNPDNYNATIRWLANHPWVQFVTLEEVASWGWRPVERGQRSDLAMTTYHWLNHATETSYENWYYGSSQEEAFADLHPALRPGVFADKRFGDVWTPGTLFHDAWQAVRAMPAGNLKALAEATYVTAIFETAWHDEDQNDYYARDEAGRYLKPDTSYDHVSGWAFGMHNKVRDAVIIAHAGAWAASSPAPATVVERVDVDDDGELEVVLRNDRVYAVFEDDGGRLVMAFARRARDGEAVCVIGAPVVDPGARRESELEGDFRISGLRDHWAEGGGARYINDRYRITLQPSGLALESSDGRIRKVVTLAAGADRLEVRYEVDAAAGTLYTRHGLSPAVFTTMMEGQAGLSEVRQAERFGLRRQAVGGTAQAMLEATGWNTKVPDGPLSDGRNAALTQQVELPIRGQRSFSLILSAW